MAEREPITVLVTGGNRGIGLEICRELASQGDTVVMGSRKLAAGEAARKALGKLAEKITVVELAIDEPASIAACLERIGAAPGRLDVLINNAGVFFKNDAPAATLDPAMLEKTLRTNLYGTLAMCQACLPLLRKSARPRIINLSSNMGQLEAMGSGSAAYRISKTAINALTQTLASDLKAEKIPVYAVSPGWVRTDMGGPKAPDSVAYGADTPVWLATAVKAKQTGSLWRHRREIVW